MRPFSFALALASTICLCLAEERQSLRHNRALRAAETAGAGQDQEGISTKHGEGSSRFDEGHDFEAVRQAENFRAAEGPAFRETSVETGSSMETSSFAASMAASLNAALFETTTAWSQLQLFEQQSLYSFLLSSCNVGSAETSYNSAFFARLLTSTRPDQDDATTLPTCSFPQGLDPADIYQAVNGLLDIGHCQAQESAEDLVVGSAALTTSAAPLKSWVLHALFRDSLLEEAIGSNANGRSASHTASVERLAAAGDIIQRELQKVMAADVQTTGIKKKMAVFKGKLSALVTLSTEAPLAEANENKGPEENANGVFAGLQGSVGSEKESPVAVAFRELIQAFLDVAVDPSLFAIKAAFGSVAGGLCTASQPADFAQQSPAERKRGRGLSFGCSAETVASLSRLYGVSLWKQAYSIAAKDLEVEFTAALVKPLEVQENKARADARAKKAEAAKLAAQKAAEQKQEDEDPIIRKRSASFILKQGLGDMDTEDLKKFQDESIEKAPPADPLITASDQLERALELQRLRQLHFAQTFYIGQTVLQLHDDPCTIADLDLPPALFVRVAPHQATSPDRQQENKPGNTFAPSSSGWVDPLADWALRQEVKALFINSIKTNVGANEENLNSKARPLLDASSASTSPLQNGNPRGRDAKAIVDSKTLTTLQATTLKGQAAAAAPKGLSSSTSAWILFKRLGWATDSRDEDVAEQANKIGKQSSQVLEIAKDKEEEEEAELFRQREGGEEDGRAGVSRITLSKAYLSLVSTVRTSLRAALFAQAPPPYSADPQPAQKQKSELWLPLPANYRGANHPGLQPVLKPEHVFFTALRQASENFLPFVTAANPLPSSAEVNKEKIGTKATLPYPPEIAETAKHLRDFASFILALEVSWQYGPTMPGAEEVVRPPLDFLAAAQIAYGQGLHSKTFSMSLSGLKKFSEDQKALGIFEKKNADKWQSRSLDVTPGFISYREDAPAPSGRNPGPAPSPDPFKAKRAIAFSSVAGIAVPVPQGRVAIKAQNVNDLGVKRVTADNRASHNNDKLIEDFLLKPQQSSEPALDAASEMMAKGHLCATVLENANLDNNGHRGVRMKPRRSAEGLHSSYQTERTKQDHFELLSANVEFYRHNAAVMSVLPDPSPYSRYFLFCTRDPMPMPRAPVPQAPRGRPQPPPGPVLHSDPSVAAWVEKQAKPLVAQMCVAAHSLGLLEQFKLEQWFSWTVWATRELTKRVAFLHANDMETYEDRQYIALRELKGTLLHPDVAAAFFANAAATGLLDAQGQLDCNVLMTTAPSNVVIPNADGESFPLDLAVTSFQRINAGPNLMGKVALQLDALARVVIRDTWSGNVRNLLQQAYWKNERKAGKDLGLDAGFKDEVVDRLAEDSTAYAFQQAQEFGESPKREMALLRRRKAGATALTTAGRYPDFETRQIMGRHAAMTRGKPVALTLSPTARLMVELSTSSWGSRGRDPTSKLMECQWPKEAMSSARDSPLLGTSSIGGQAAWQDYWFTTSGGATNILTSPPPPSAIPASCKSRLGLVTISDPSDPGWKPSFTNVWVSNTDRLIIVAFSYQRANEELAAGSRINGYSTMSDLLNDSYGSDKARLRYLEHDRVLDIVMRTFGAENYQFVFTGWCFGGAAAHSYSRKYNVPSFVINPAPTIMSGIRYRFAVGAALGGLSWLLNTATLGIPRVAVNQLQKLSPDSKATAWSRMIFPRRWKFGSWVDDERNDLFLTQKPPTGNGITHIYAIAGDWASALYLAHADPEDKTLETMLPKTEALKPGAGSVKTNALPYSAAGSSLTSKINGVSGQTGVLDPGSFYGNGYSFTLFPCLPRRNEAAAHNAFNLLLFPLSSDPMLELSPGVSVEGKELGSGRAQMEAWRKWHDPIYKAESTVTATNLKGAVSSKTAALAKAGPPPKFKWPAAMRFPDFDPKTSHSSVIGYDETFSILHTYDRILEGFPLVTNLVFPENRAKAYDLRFILQRADVKREEKILKEINDKKSKGSSGRNDPAPNNGAGGGNANHV